MRRQDERRWIEDYNDPNDFIGLLFPPPDDDGALYLEIKDTEPEREQQRLQEDLIEWRQNCGLCGPLRDHLLRHTVHVACTDQGAGLAAKVLDDVITGRSEDINLPKNKQMSALAALVSLDSEDDDKSAEEQSP